MTSGTSNATDADLVESFSRLVDRETPDEQIDLLAGALLIARTEYPDLALTPYVERIGGYAERVRRRLGDAIDARSCIAALNRVLFDEEELRGNADDYYDPRNSFLNDVLDRRLGIPITLSVVYLEVGRRVGFPLVGVGMPGHFLLKHYEVSGDSILIDVFDRGRIVTERECQSRLDSIYSGQVALQPDFLVPVTRRQILLRMLNNLRNTYLSSRSFRKAIQTVDLVLAIYPRSPEDVKQRGILHYQVDQLARALPDFETYLKMSPEASDADDIRQITLSIRRTLASLN